MANAQTIQVNLKMVSDISDVTSNMSNVQKALGSLKLPDNLKTSFSKTFSDIEKETNKIQGLMSSGFKKKGDVTALENSYKKINQLMFQLQGNMNKISPKVLNDSFQLDPAKIEASKNQIQGLVQQLNQKTTMQQELTNVQAAIDKLKDKGGKSKIAFLENLKSGDFQAAQQNINTLTTAMGRVKSETERAFYAKQIEVFQNALNSLGQTPEIQQLITQLEQARIEAQNINQVEFTKFINQFNATKGAVEQLPPQIRKVGQAAVEAGGATAKMATEMDQLKSRITHFFGLTNAVNLFRRAVISAFNTVKELDATMTEAAVVTEFSVGDMWGKLPEYAANASKLGATINDLYGATTLYYQQGLKTNEAMALGTETMKMARVANMESAAATEAMTAALRGFNMELNETSATRVNDVYSELAAITAADTEQIATAMSKTASIASAANMEFESTAAFLSQIIETTQEAPETAGTALKTIIARFSEVKSLREKGLSSGEDSEGELIDVNKIQGALRTVGISMNEFFAGTEGLDSVLMKLAAKWGTLDFETQRYIATTAAGSRQQSRFIAMMSNYDRTMELVGAANNSAGASQEQFNKTLESLDSKLNNLKNAWDEFVMGLANNKLIKDGVDVLTFLLETINKIISSLSGGSGIVKTFVTAIGAIGAFKLGQKGLNKIAPGLASKMFGDGKKLGQGWALKLGAGIKDGISKIKSGDMGKALLKKIGFVNKQIKGEDLTKEFGFDELDFSNVNIEGVESIKEEIMEQTKWLPDEIKKSIDLNKIQDATDVDGIVEGLGPAKDSIKLMGQDAAAAGAQLNQMQASMQTVGTVAGAAGGALMMFAGILEEAGASDELVTVVKGLGIAFMALSAVMPIIQSGFVATGAAGVSSGVATQLAWWWVMLIVAAVALLVAGFVALGKAAQKASPEGQLKQAKKDLEETQEAVEALTEKYNELKDTIDSIDESQKSLKRLTKGTLEWKEAVLKLNNQIRELAIKYPELKDFIVSDGGVLSLDINSPEVQDILQQEYDQMLTSQTMMMAQQHSVSSKEDAIAADEEWEKKNGEAYEEARLSNYYAGVDFFVQQKTLTGVTQTNEDGEVEEIEAFTGAGYYLSEDSQQALIAGLAERVQSGELTLASEDAEGSFNKNSEAIEKAIIDIFSNDSAFADLGFDEEEIALNAANLAPSIANNVSALQTFSEKMLAVTPVVDTFTKELSQQAALIGKLNEKGYSDDQIQSAETYGAIIGEELLEQIRSEVANEDQEKIKKEFAKELDLTYISGNKYLKTNADGSTEEVEYSQSAVQEMVAAARATKEISKKQEAFIQTSQRVAKNDDVGKALVKAYKSDEGLGLSSKDVNILKKFFTYDEETQKNIVNTENEAELQKKYAELGGDEIFNSYEEFIEWVSGSVGNFEQVQKDAVTAWQEVLSPEALTDQSNVMAQAISGEEGTFDISKIIPKLENVDLTSGQLQGLSNSLIDVFKAGGNVEEVGNKISSLLSTIGAEDMPAAMDILSQTDFTDANAIRDSIDAIENLGYEIDDSLTQQIISLSHAAERVNLGKIKEQIGALNEAINTVNEKAENDEKIYNEQEYGQLIELEAAKASDFERVGIDEYVYLGETESLLTSLDNNVGKILAEMQGDIDSAVDKGSKFKNWLDTQQVFKKDPETGKEIEGTRYVGEGIIGAFKGGALTAANFQTEESRKILEGWAIESGVVAAEDINQYTPETLISAIVSFFDNYVGTGGQVLEQNKAIQEENQAPSYWAQTSTSSFTTSSAASAHRNSLESRKERGDVAGQENHNFYIKEATDGLKAQAIQLGVSDSLLDEYNKALEDYDKNQNDATRAALEEKEAEVANAIARKKSIKETQKRIKNLNKLQEEYENLVDTEDKIRNVQDQVNAMGFDIEVNKENYERVRQMLARLEAGSYAAYEGLMEMSAADFGITVDFSANNEAFLAQVNSNKEAWRNFVDYMNETGQLVEQEVTWEDYSRMVEQNVKFIDPVTKLPVQYKTQADFEAAGGTMKLLRPKTAKEIKTESNFSSGKKSGGGGGSKPKNQVAKNPYDELYNTHQKVDETLRERNQLEREYDRLLENREVSIEKLLENQAKQLKNLRQEYNLQKKIAKQELKDALDAKNYEYIATRKNGDKEEEFWSTFQKEADYYGIGDLEQFGKYDSEIGEIDIKWDKIEAFEDDEKHSKDMIDLIHEYVSHIEEQSDAYEEANDRLEEIEDEIAEIKKQAMQDYLDFEQKIYDALVQQAQQEIDDMQSFSDTLSEANSSILDSLQESIDLERQIRDNTKQEEDIADMEARLAYLRRDTSGANALEIKQLEEQLGDARESYSDSLIDQQLQKMSDDNAKAEEQRQNQIDLAQAQLDYWTEIGYFWPQVNTLIADAAKAEDFSETDLADVLKDTEGFKGMSYFGKKNWMYELAQEFALAGQGKSNWKVEEAEQAGKLERGQTIDEKGESVGTLTYDKESKTWKGNGGSYSSISWDEAKGTYVASDFTPDKKEETEITTTPTEPTESYPYGKPSEATKTVKKGQSGRQVKAVQYALNKLGYGNSGTSSVDGKFGSNTEKAVKSFQSAMGIKKDGQVGPNTRAKFKLKKFKTGGIADFTGPAWLDGTKSKPEIILNQQDSKNFIMLKDILGEILQGATSGKSAEKSGGDNYFDISIIVDEISSDYDVDKMAARIKQQIYDDSTYRNVNAINLIR